MLNRTLQQQSVRMFLLVILLSVAGWPLAGIGQTGGGSDATDVEFWEELAFWEAIQDSNNPDEFALYLELYPQGRFAPLARIRMEALRGESEAPAPPVEPEPVAPVPTTDETFRDCPECPLMAVIPAGTFRMGSEHRPDEQPVHEVRIARDFALGVHPVTVGEWRHCVDAGACRFRPDPGHAPDWPVSGISWDDAQAYVQWLSDVTAADYRLPSEAEWEYAARAGTTTDFWWGDDPGDTLANCRGCGSPWDGEQPSPVGAFQPNPFGLYDIHGNIWEWTADCWRNNYRNAAGDGSPYTERHCIEGVQRGGAYRLESEYMRVSRRFRYDRDVRFMLNGIRVARTLD